jgi:hypothetical protein
MQGFDYHVVTEINQLRTNPQEYAKKIRKYKNYFKGNVLHLPGRSVGIRTHEGASAYEEAAEFLEKHSKISALKINYSLNLIASDYLKEIQKAATHTLNDINIDSIMSKYGSFTGEFSNMMDFGGDEPEVVISNLLVSDGRPERNQRRTFFNSNLHLIGVAHGEHNEYGHCTVIITCTTFKSLDPKNDNIVFTDEKIEKPTLHNEPTKLKGGRKPTNQADNTAHNYSHSQHSHVVEEDIPEGVKKVVKNESVVVEGGKKKKVIKTIKYMEDGSVQTEIEKETIG